MTAHIAVQKKVEDLWLASNTPKVVTSPSGSRRLNMKDAKETHLTYHRFVSQNVFF